MKWNLGSLLLALAVLVLSVRNAHADSQLQELQVFPPDLRPGGGLVQAIDGYFYGVTEDGGEFGAGTIYRLTPGSPIETVYSFQALVPWADPTLVGGEVNVGGSTPRGTLIATPEGSLYGYTFRGGAYGMGVVFQYDLDGTFTTLLDFTNETGADPQHMIRTKDGDIYLLTNGGADFANSTLLRFHDGQFNPVYSFRYWERQGGRYTSPYLPYFLVEAADGQIFGISQAGGLDDTGVVFRLDRTGKITIFDEYKSARERPNYLIAAPDGSFYGTDATRIFRMNSEGELSTLWAQPYSYDAPYNLFWFSGSFNRLIIGEDQHLYGETTAGGTLGGGYVFKMSPQGEMTVLYNFSQEYLSLPRTGIAAGNDGFLYFVTKAPSTGTVGLHAVNQVRVAASSSTPTSAGKAFRIQVSDPLNGDLPPLARADQVLLDASSGSVAETSVDVLANDQDPDGDPLSIISATKPKYGTVRIEGNSLYYTPDNPLKIQSDQCRYVISDGRGGTASAVVTFRAAFAGQYSGKLKAVNAGSARGATYSLSVAADGKVTGRITIGKNTYPVGGYLGADDRLKGKFVSPKRSIVRLDLKVVFKSTRKLQGKITPVRKAFPAVYTFR